MRKLTSLLFPKIEEFVYELVSASRRVVKSIGDKEHSGDHFYDENLWAKIGSEFTGKLIQGETVYGECAGFTQNGKPIQAGYDYFCDPTGIIAPQCKLFIYRITRTSPDGTVTELQWNQVKERAKELDVPTVPEIFYGLANNYFGMRPIRDNNGTVEFDDVVWGDMLLESLKSRYVHDQDCHLCRNKVPAEGIVLRREGLNIEAFKLKNFRFLEAETKQLDNGEVDIETQES